MEAYSSTNEKATLYKMDKSKAPKAPKAPKVPKLPKVHKVPKPAESLRKAPEEQTQRERERAAQSMSALLAMKKKRC